MRSAFLDGVGLQQLISECQSHEPAISVDFLAETLVEDSLPRDVETIVYSIIQEALTNVYRHAHARHITLTVERDGDVLTLIVSDDGEGFDTDIAEHQTGLGRLGLVGMRERAALVGGSLNIDSAPGEGTMVTARVPVPPFGDGIVLAKQVP